MKKEDIIKLLEKKSAFILTDGSYDDYTNVIKILYDSLNLKGRFLEIRNLCSLKYTFEYKEILCGSNEKIKLLKCDNKRSIESPYKRGIFERGKNGLIHLNGFITDNIDVSNILLEAVLKRRYKKVGESNWSTLDDTIFVLSEESEQGIESLLEYSYDSLMYCIIQSIPILSIDNLPYGIKYANNHKNRDYRIIDIEKEYKLNL